jgi:hypothetical protein
MVALYTCSALLLLPGMVAVLLWIMVMLTVMMSMVAM